MSLLYYIYNIIILLYILYNYYLSYCILLPIILHMSILFFIYYVIYIKKGFKIKKIYIQTIYSKYANFTCVFYFWYGHK